MNSYYYLLFIVLSIGILMGYRLGYQKGRVSVLRERVEELEPINKKEKTDLDKIKDVLDFIDSYFININKLKKIQLEEVLMRNLLKLDEVESQYFREIRRTLIKEIQRLQTALDQERI